MVRLESRLELAFGKHDLKTFQQPDFAPWALKKEPQEKRTHWLVEHEGRTVAVRKNTGAGMLLHVLRDPVHKGNLLVLRKADPHHSHDLVRLLTVHPSGVETQLGTAGLWKGRDNIAEISQIGLVPYDLRKPYALPARSDRLSKQVREAGERVRAEYDSTKKHNELWEKANQLRSELEGELADLYTSRVYPRPAGQWGQRVYNYRKRGLAHLLISLQEELAQKAGAKGIRGLFDPRTTGRFLPKHGWKREEQSQSSPNIWLRKMFR